MEYIFIGILIFLFILAIFDLSAGVSNDAAQDLNQAQNSDMAVLYIYINMLQESQEIVSNLRKMLRADAKLLLSPQTRIRVQS